MADSGNSMVAVDVVAGTTTITLDRAERHNSLVPQLLAELRDAVRNCEASSRGPVVLRAAGPSFSTGGDLQGFVDHASNIREYSDRLVGLLNEAIIAIFDCPLPVVVAVDGQVTGGSLGFVLAADLVLVTDRASFRPYYTDVGLSPDGGWAVLLPDIIGRKRASAVQLLNQTITAEQALDWGLATAYANSEDLDEALEELCLQLRGKRPGSIHQTRRLLRPDELGKRLDDEKQRFLAQVETPEAIAGIRRFLGMGDDHV